MSDTTVTRADLANAVYREMGLSRADSNLIVESIINHVLSALLKGEKVKIAGFGTFEVRKNKARTGRNPKTGKLVPIEARKVLVFRPSVIFKKRVNSALAKK